MSDWAARLDEATGQGDQRTQRGQERERQAACHQSSFKAEAETSRRVKTFHVVKLPKFSASTLTFDAHL